MHTLLCKRKIDNYLFSWLFAGLERQKFQYFKFINCFNCIKCSFFKPALWVKTLQMRSVNLSRIKWGKKAEFFSKIIFVAIFRDSLKPFSAIIAIFLLLSKSFFKQLFMYLEFSCFCSTFYCSYWDVHCTISTVLRWDN